MKIKQQRIYQAPGVRETKLFAAQVNKGMVTMVDAAEIDNGALQMAKNAVVRFDKTSRRSGLNRFYVNPPPNSLPVLKIVTIKKRDGNAWTIRFTPTTLHRVNGIGWTALVDNNTVGQTLAGTINDRIQTSMVLDNLVFTNNGVNEIQVINNTFTGFAKLGNAPKYRYVAGIYNRVVGAAIRNSDEIMIGWSGDANITQWNPLTDETAGSTPLIDSPSDLSDFITGLFAFSNRLIVPREKSIWIGNKQPSPTEPFYFYAAIPGVGCDSPYSAHLIANGISWLDRRTRTVYAFNPDSGYEAIGRPIEKNILDGLDDPKTIFASYDPINDESSFNYIRVGSDLVSNWVFNYRNKAWTYNEYEQLSSMDDVEVATAGTTIDELVGTINDLKKPDGTPVTIDGLSPTSINISSRLLGRRDGEIFVIDPLSALDYDAEFQTILVSKVIVQPTLDQYITKIVFEYIQQVGGQFQLWYSRNGGATDSSWVLAKTVNPAIIGEPQIFKFKKMIRGRRMAWKITSVGGIFDVLSYEVFISPSSEARK